MRFAMNVAALLCVALGALTSTDATDTCRIVSPPAALRRTAEPRPVARRHPPAHGWATGDAPGGVQAPARNVATCGLLSGATIANAPGTFDANVTSDDDDGCPFTFGHRAPALVCAAPRRTAQPHRGLLTRIWAIKCGCCGRTFAILARLARRCFQSTCRGTLLFLPPPTDDVQLAWSRWPPADDVAALKRRIMRVPSFGWATSSPPAVPFAGAPVCRAVCAALTAGLMLAPAATAAALAAHSLLSLSSLASILLLGPMAWAVVASPLGLLSLKGVAGAACAQHGFVLVAPRLLSVPGPAAALANAALVCVVAVAASRRAGHFF